MRKSIFLISIIILSAIIAEAKISEKELSRQRGYFLSKFLDDNSEMEDEIRSSLSTIISEENSRIRLIDKFALFVYDFRQKGSEIEKTKFFIKGKNRVFFIVLKDRSDSQSYNLFVEYEISSDRKSAILRDLYFSIVFDEKRKEMEKFFRSR